MLGYSFTTRKPKSVIYKRKSVDYDCHDTAAAQFDETKDSLSGAGFADFLFARMTYSPSGAGFADSVFALVTYFQHGAGFADSLFALVTNFPFSF